MDPGEKVLEGPRLFDRACRVMADGIPRSTREADFVVELSPHSLQRLEAHLPAGLRLECQGAFEAVTGTMRACARHGHTTDGDQGSRPGRIASAHRSSGTNPRPPPIDYLTGFLNVLGLTFGLILTDSMVHASAARPSIEMSIWRGTITPSSFLNPDRCIATVDSFFG